MAFQSVETYGNLGTGPLSDADLRRVAPSIFAPDKHTSRSERYTFIPTSGVVEAMRENGLLPYFAKQGRTKVEGKGAFTKHMIRFRAPQTDVAARTLGGIHPEVVLVNSHDGTSRYKLWSGLWRTTCLNGMIAWFADLMEVLIPHKGDVRQDVIDASFTVVDTSNRAIETATKWSAIQLQPKERLALADRARVLRFGDEDGNVAAPFTAEQMLMPRRRADLGTDLWTTHNILQEAIVRGGVYTLERGADGRSRYRTSREVKAIDADVRLNRGLWQLSQEVADQHGVAA